MIQSEKLIKPEIIITREVAVKTKLQALRLLSCLKDSLSDPYVWAGKKELIIQLSFRYCVWLFSGSTSSAAHAPKSIGCDDKRCETMNIRRESFSLFNRLPFILSGRCYVTLFVKLWAGPRNVFCAHVTCSRAVSRSFEIRSNTCMSHLTVLIFKKPISWQV